MTAAVVEIPGQGHRAVCEDEACAKTTKGVGFTLTVHWRTWMWSEVRAASLAADHNRTRHGAK